MKMWRHRSIPSHMKTLYLLPYLSSSSSSSPSSSTNTIKAIRTLFSLSSNPSSSTLLPPSPHSLSLPQTLILRPTSHPSNFNSRITHGFGFLLAKCVSSISSAHTVDWNEPVTYSEDGDSNSGGVSEEDTKSSIPVRAFFFSTSVDLRRLVEQNKPNFIPPTSRMTNYVVLRFGNEKPGPNGLGANLSGSDDCFMVVFQYGSIVLFNVHDHKIDGYLKIVEQHASGLLPEMRKDDPGSWTWLFHPEAARILKSLALLANDTPSFRIKKTGLQMKRNVEYEVREKPALNTWMQGGLDYIMLQYLNIDGIRTVGSVLGQSIALDYYVRQVDGMVAEFTDINRGMEKTGTFTMERKKLFQLVGKANSNLADVILKLGLFERSDIAWKDAKYAQIWEYLRDEFELTQRFASLDFKLKFVEHNIRFLQEILQNRKSDFLEWLIIILISAEILISVYDIAHRSAITHL
ncbi:hypothetical protein RHSIM_Rhsim03G0122000 [Rhododendron simsii]|uniref:DUF155 domain-containing protein n=1 Tax=Rhododendron simsii TaxID=118357 RepID=A0A834H577_RHOSS|nr:hypothetical protein RHSIM_Rhsim03G0122000 [Rhododendron simsii]